MIKSKIFLIFHGRFPSEKAASIFAAKSAESFAKHMEVVLVVPRRFGRIKSDPYEFYNVSKSFKIVYLPTIDLFNLPIFGKIAFFVSYLLFSLSTLFYLLFNASKEDIVYSNENLPILFISFFFKNSFYEMHDFPAPRFYFYYKLLLKRVRWILIHNKWKADKAKDVLNVSKGKIICELNAVELSDFGSDILKSDARRKLGIDSEIKMVVYTGHLYGWKGANILADAARMLPESVVVYFVGGTEDDIRAFKLKYKIGNVIFVGHRNHSEIPFWQAAADVLVIPNTAKEDISKYYTSPMKLFEYMASSRPIVASRIPSIEEIVSDDEVYFFEPDDSEDLAKKISLVLSDGYSASARVLSAKGIIQEHSWNKRVDRIIKFIRR